MNAKTCSFCHSPVPENAPGGLCPACVLRGADEPAADSSAAPSLADVAAAFPKLEIIRLIGHGGMGFVYQARQTELERTVALKILSPSLRSDPAFEERFAREARVLGKLQHPNIVTLYEHGESGGFFYLLMEYIDGVNLRQAMSAGRFTPEQALAIVPAICDALQSAHAQGVWHRDIKPENILLDRDGRVKIADFGIARILGDPQRNFTLTRTGGQLGSAAYMAPEQHEKPHDVDHRADIYSLGVVIYEMLTGELPLGRFPAPSQRAAVNERIDEIVLRTLEKERELRQQSADEVKTDMCAAAIPARAQDHPKPSLGPTILLHALLFALLATIFLFVLPGFAEVLREMGVPRHTLPRIFLFQTVGGLRSVSGLLLFPVLFGIDVGLCFLVRKIGGRRGLRLWNAAFIVGMISIMAIASLALYLPMKRVIGELGGPPLVENAIVSGQSVSNSPHAQSSDLVPIPQAPLVQRRRGNNTPKTSPSQMPSNQVVVLPPIIDSVINLNELANTGRRDQFQWSIKGLENSTYSSGPTERGKTIDYFMDKLSGKMVGIWSGRKENGHCSIFVEREITGGKREFNHLVFSPGIGRWMVQSAGAAQLIALCRVEFLPETGDPAKRLAVLLDGGFQVPVFEKGVAVPGQFDIAHNLMPSPITDLASPPKTVTDEDAVAATDALLKRIVAKQSTLGERTSLRIVMPTRSAIPAFQLDPEVVRIHPKPADEIRAEPESPQDAIEAIFKAAREDDRMALIAGCSRSVVEIADQDGRLPASLNDLARVRFAGEKVVDERTVQVLAETTDGSSSRFTYWLILEDGKWKLTEHEP